MQPIFFIILSDSGRDGYRAKPHVEHNQPTPGCDGVYSLSMRGRWQCRFRCSFWKQARRMAKRPCTLGAGIFGLIVIFQ